MTPKPLKAVQIDIDGTLLDSNEAHAQAWVDVLRDGGHDVPFGAVRALIGKGGDKLLREVAGLDADSGEGKHLSDAQTQHFGEHFLKHLSPTPGARALLERLRDDGVRLVIATSAGGEQLAGLLKQAGVADLIDGTATSSDAKDSKPDPDIVRAELDEAGVEPDEAMMLGDTPYDIESAGRAGVGTIAFRCGGWWDDAALVGAQAIYDHPAALPETLVESPLHLDAGPSRVT